MVKFQAGHSSEKVYEVEAVVGKKIEDFQPFYLVKWRNHSLSSWEPLSSLNNSLHLIYEYERTHRKPSNYIKKTGQSSVLLQDQKIKKQLSESQRVIKQLREKWRRKLDKMYDLEEWMEECECKWDVKRVTGHARGKNGLEFEVSWGRKFGFKPKKTVIPLEEAEKIAPKQLIAYLVRKLYIL